MPYSILLVDDSPAIRDSLRLLIEPNHEWNVCGEAENGAIAIKMVHQLRPDVVMLDLQMPVMGGLEAARQIAVMHPSTVMLMFTLHPCEQLSRDAKTVGITRVLSKSEGSADVLASLNQFVLDHRAA